LINIREWRKKMYRKMQIDDAGTGLNQGYKLGKLLSHERKMHILQSDVKVFCFDGKKIQRYF